MRRALVIQKIHEGPARNRKEGRDDRVAVPLTLGFSILSHIDLHKTAVPLIQSLGFAWNLTTILEDGASWHSNHAFVPEKVSLLHLQFLSRFLQCHHWSRNVDGLLELLIVHGKASLSP